jgi:PAS domain S-box-containing protein
MNAIFPINQEMGYSGKFSPDKKRQSWALKRFVLTAIVILVINVITDFFLGRTEVALAELIVSVLLSISLYLNKYGFYEWAVSIALVLINILLFTLDSYIGAKGGTYLYFYPVFLAIPFLLSFDRKVLMGSHICFTIICWAILELTDHSLFFNHITAPEVVRSVFFINMVLAISASGCLVYFLSQKIEGLISDRESQKQQVILQSSPQVMILVDAKGKLEMFNERAIFHFQTYSHKTLETGKYFMEYFYGDNAASFEALFHQALNGKVIEDEYQCVAGLYWNVTFTPVFDKKGNIKNIVICGTDITVHKEAELHLQEQNKSLNKFNEELNKLTYKISHDLRSPLASVLGLIEITQFVETIEEKNQYLEMMRSNVKRLDSMIISLISMAKNSGTDLLKDQIDFESFTEHLFDSVRFAENAIGIRLEADIKQTTEFINDKERLNIVLGNLLSNAIRYSNPSERFPFVKIEVKVSERDAIILVKDNGIGIAREEQYHIFEMFYKAGNHKSGSGLGLSIVKETLASMKGSISVESEIGKGSIFKVVLPNHKITSKTESVGLQLDFLPQ